VRHIWLSSVTFIALTACSTTVQPLTNVQVNEAAEALQDKISTRQEPVTQTITLYEAMARALKYNLKHRVAMMEIDFARADYELSRYDVIPNVVAGAGSYSRNNQSGASSLSLISGRQSLEPSTATEKTFRTGDFSATWNILDFGLSKIRSEQLADEALIYEERRRKATLQIIGDVHRAYWRAVTAQRLNQRVSALEDDIQASFDNSRTLYTSRKTAPLRALSYQRDLTDIQAELRRIARDLSRSKVELSRLMGLSPHQSFRLKDVDHEETPQALAMDYEAMIDMSLRQRPEVRETLYAKRIGDKEMKKAVLDGAT